MCTYCHKGFHPKISCMKKTIDMMDQLLENNNLLVRKSAWRKYASSCTKDKERHHALMEITSHNYFIIDSGASRHMDSKRESFTIFQSFRGPLILMWHELEIPSQGKGIIDLDNGSLQNVLYFPILFANIIFWY